MKQSKCSLYQKITKYKKAGKNGTIIECPECTHQEIIYHFSWHALVCPGCKATIEKTDYLLPKLSSDQEAKVRATHEAERRKLPKGLKILDKEPVKVKNPYMPGKWVILQPDAAAVYDWIKGSEVLEQYEDVQIGLHWFRINDPEAYMILLD